MKTEYYFVHPDIDEGGGETKELISKLALSWRAGANEGGGAIAAVAALLTDPEVSTLAFKLVEGGPNHRLAKDFSAFLTQDVPKTSKYIAKSMQYNEITSLPLFATGLGTATGAMTAALIALGAAGGEVIVTSLNYVGVLNAVIMAGAIPRFVDIDPLTFCMDPASMEEALTENTKAVIITHLNECMDLLPFMEALERKGIDIPVLQDASLAVGSMRGGVKPGLINIGAQGMTVFSLSISKIISGMGGAMLTSNDEVITKRIAAIAYQGLSLMNTQVIDEYGMNGKMSAINALIASENLKRCDALFARRRTLREIFDATLLPLAKRGKLRLQQLSSEAVVTHYAVVVKERGLLAKRLIDRHGIQSALWHCFHRERLYEDLLGKRSPSLKHTEVLGKNFLFLPFHTRLTDDDARAICKALEIELGKV